MFSDHITPRYRDETVWWLHIHTPVNSIPHSFIRYYLAFIINYSKKLAQYMYFRNTCTCKCNIICNPLLHSPSGNMNLISLSALRKLSLPWRPFLVWSVPYLALRVSGASCLARAALVGPSNSLHSAIASGFAITRAMISSLCVCVCVCVCALAGDLTCKAYIPSPCSIVSPTSPLPFTSIITCSETAAKRKWGWP